MVRFLVAAMVMVAVCSALPQEPPPPPPPAAGGPPPPTPGAAAPPPPPPPPSPPAAPAGGAAPAKGSGETASITSSNSVINADGSFNYSYELSNGIKAEQSGYLKPGNGSSSGPQARLGAEGGADDEGSGDGVQVVSGSFSYVAPDGQTISVRYTADETGYHPMIDYGGQGGQGGQAGQAGQPGQPGTAGLAGQSGQPAQ